MAGSKVRRNIQGHTVIAELADLTMLRRQSSALLGRIFREAQEQGETSLAIDGLVFSLRRHSDHTFTLESRTTTQHTPW